MTKLSMKYMTSKKLTDAIATITPSHQWLVIGPGSWARDPLLAKAIRNVRRWNFSSDSKALAIYRVTGMVQVHQLSGDVIHICPDGATKCDEDTGVRCVHAPILYMTRNSDGRIKDNIKDLTRRAGDLFIAGSSPE